ncbi:MAG TPA: hypothetical protein VIG51_03235 [Candidatus Baltobacteraceae bacterium]
MSISRFRAAAAGLTSALFLSTILTACGGGSSGTPAIPATQPNNGATLPAPSQGHIFSAQGEPVTEADRAAAGTATNLKRHIMLPVSTAKKTQSIVYPADLTYGGGPLLTHATVWNIYVNSKPSDFGNPSTFERNLGASSMIHITDQYVHVDANNRYTPGQFDLIALYPTYTALADNDLLAILHHFGQFIGGGYHNVYNIFLPKGIDVCETGLAACNASFTSPAPAFCAFHSSVDFQDIGHVLFTLEPFQEPAFCGVNALSGAKTTPNGVLNDSTYSTLSHELFETITDPDPISGWFTGNVGVSGEIGDLCAYLPETQTLNGKAYYLQREYSNSVHGCSSAP